MKLISAIVAGTLALSSSVLANESHTASNGNCVAGAPCQNTWGTNQKASKQTQQRHGETVTRGHQTVGGPKGAGPSRLVEILAVVGLAGLVMNLAHR